MSEGAAATIRLDKWLWYARFLKTRGLAAKLVSDGKVRVNSERVDKPSRAVRPGDVLTFPQGRQIRVIRIQDVGTRRGPAPEAQDLYEDLSPPKPPEAAAIAETPGAGRPTKRDRRQIDRLRDRRP